MGAACGVILHFARDIATGPGLPLWWPLGSGEVRLPYVSYVVLLVALAAIATGRALASSNTMEGSAVQRR